MFFGSILSHFFDAFSSSLFSSAGSEFSFRWIYFTSKASLAASQFAQVAVLVLNLLFSKEIQIEDFLV